MEFIHIDVKSTPHTSKYQYSVKEIEADSKVYREWLSNRKKEKEQSLGPTTYQFTSSDPQSTNFSKKDPPLQAAFASQIPRLPSPNSQTPSPQTYHPNHNPTFFTSTQPSPSFISPSVPSSTSHHDSSPGPSHYDAFASDLEYTQPTLTPLGHACVFKSTSNRFDSSTDVPLVPPNAYETAPKNVVNVLPFDAYSSHSTTTWLPKPQYKASPASYLPLQKPSTHSPKFSTSINPPLPPTMTGDVGPGAYSIAPAYPHLSNTKSPPCSKWHSSSSSPKKSTPIASFYNIESAEKAMRSLSKRHRLPKLNEDGKPDWI